ncbi:hypothetical protein Osc7112_0854 [Oscillatoria nigro-viridis PCC 7112]|uniref:Serine/threonine protein kinase n=1 Tax=Phormidium nigroviride PCC 7112 TaxID=179408 RepID=K9VD86_9CYAN|nr:hypothetical protein [Oscillatoria nigro-viridis]AFZ05432.1 hypothetical protein Osc7112_0854 [Oscillatoria nigro-viridis PCC 7112]
MSDEQEKKQILTQPPETISPTSDEFDRSEIASSDSTSAPPETPAEIAAPEDISAPIDAAETIPIAADSAPETTQITSYPPPTIPIANPDAKPARSWQILAVFLSGMLVGSVLSLGSLLAWRMYQERANLQIKLPADVPLPESPSPVATAPVNRRPGLPPAPGTRLPATIPPSPRPTQIPSLSGVPQLASPLPSPSPSPSPTPAAVETPVTERVYFQAGATGTTLSNSLRANISRRYLLECNSGQTMTINVQEGQVSAAIIAPNGENLGTADSTGQWQGQLASSGDYTIEISGDRQANYQVKIEVK